MKKIIFIGIILISLTSFYIISYKTQEIVKIGFVAGLTGKYSVLGNEVLSGIELSLNEQNYKVNGKKIELIVQDDKQTVSVNRKIIKKFINDDIKLIIGNTTSSMTKVSLQELKNYEDRLLLSVTASSSEFSNLDDNFIRTQVSLSSSKYDEITKYLIKHNKRNIVVVYDSSNKSYTKSVMDKFKYSMMNKGGKDYLKVFQYNSDFSKLSTSIKKLNPDVVFLIANSNDTAKFVQFLRLKKINSLIFSSGWALNNYFFTDAGKAADGVLFVSDYNANSKDLAFLNFKKKYIKKYNKIPASSALKAYETMNIILEALKEKDKLSIKEYILNKKLFLGLQSNLKFNTFGDVSSEYLLYKTIDSKLKRIDNE